MVFALKERERERKKAIYIPIQATLSRRANYSQKGKSVMTHSQERKLTVDTSVVLNDAISRTVLFVLFIKGCL